eukprot:gene3480-3943_t
MSSAMASQFTAQPKAVYNNALPDGYSIKITSTGDTISQPQPISELPFQGTTLACFFSDPIPSPASVPGHGIPRFPPSPTPGPSSTASCASLVCCPDPFTVPLCQLLLPSSSHTLPPGATAPPLS